MTSRTIYARRINKICGKIGNEAQKTEIDTKNQKFPPKNLVPKAVDSTNQNYFIQSIYLQNADYKGNLHANQGSKTFHFQMCKRI